MPSLEELAHHELLESGAIVYPRRQHNHAPQPLRVPVEITLIMHADQFNHASDDGLVDIAIEPRIYLDHFPPTVSRISRPASEGELRGTVAFA